MAKLELLASSPGTGKTTYCIDVFRREILKSPGGLDSRAYFVLPNREHASRIQNLILKKDVPGLFNVHILTFQDLTQRLLGPRTGLRPGSMLRQVLLRSILEDPKNDLPYFAAVRDLKGFHRLVSETLQEFKGALLDITEFERRAQPLLNDQAFRAKYRDFSIVMKLYEDKLRLLGLSEPEDCILRLSDEEDLGESVNLVIFDGFYRFSRAQERLIKLAAKHAGRIVVTLTLPKNTHGREYVFEYPARTRQFLLGLGFKEKTGMSATPRRTSDAALCHLEENIFLPKPAEFKRRQDSVQALEAEDPRGQMRMAARELRRLHREGNFHWSDLCVVFRGLSGREDELGSVFKDYEVPVHIHERKRLLESGLVRFFSRFLTLVIEDWKVEELELLLKSNYCPELPRQQLAVFFEEHRNALLSAKHGREFARRFLGFAELLRKMDGIYEERDAAALASVKEFSRMLDSGGDFAPHWALREMRTLFETGLFTLKPSGKNRVQVYDVVMALPKEYKAVLIGDLLEGSFPKQVSEHALFNDEERRQLNKGFPVLEERQQRLSGEHYFFYMAVTRAKEKLFLFYPRKDAEGRPALMSFFVRQVRTCFSTDNFQVKQEDPRPLFPWQCQARREAERGLAYALFSGEVVFSSAETKMLSSLSDSWAENPRFKRVLEAGSWRDQAVLRDKEILRRFAQEDGPFSATRLKAFVTCAFKHYSKYSLRLTEPPGSHERQWMGTILHDTLHEYFASEYSKSPEVILERHFLKSPFAQEPVFRQKVYRAKMRRTLASFLRREEELSSKRDLVPSHFETAFGKKVGGRKATYDFLRLGEEHIPIEGAMDRVDLTPDGKRGLVVDYKLGKRSFSKDLEKGLELQLPIYLLAAKRLLGVEPMGAELRFLEKGTEDGIYLEEARGLLGLGPRKRLESSDGLAAILEKTERAILEAVGRLRKGDISINSKDCDHCEYNSICRFEKWRLIYNNEEDSDE